MCTAATYKTKDFYFGRTLDYEFSYGEEVVITPRNEPFPFRYMAGCRAILLLWLSGCTGVSAILRRGQRKGLGMAGLNFVGNALLCGVSGEGKG